MSGCVSRHRLAEFAAGRLDDEDCTDVSRHLAECSTCQHELNLLTEEAHVHTLRNSDRRPLSDAPGEDFSAARGSPESERGLEDVNDPHATTPCANGRASPSLGSLGRFHLLKHLGAGGFGVVYLAEDTQLNRQVALKIPRAGTLADSEARDRFLREVRAAAALHHPQIVAVYDAGEHDGAYFLASAYCPGDTLRQWLERQGGRATPDTAAAIVLALAEAAHHAHEHGVLHRDIKPQNVLLDPTVRFRDLSFCPKLTDFSVAKLLEAEGDATATNVLVGTPRYMAPEQASGRHDLLGPTCDVYALGVVLYELITGKPPIRGNDNADTLRRVLQDEPLAPRKYVTDLPRDLEAICLRCLEKTPHHRYASAQELAEDLDRFLRREATLARPLGLGESAVRWIRRRPATASLAAASLAGVVLVVSGLLFYNARLAEFNANLEKANDRLQKALIDATRAKANAIASDDRTQQLLYVSNMRLAAKAWNDGDVPGMRELLNRNIPQAEQPDRRGLEWRFLWNQADLPSETLAALPSDLYHLQLSPDRRQLAAAGKDAVVRLFNLATGTLDAEIVTGQGEVNGVAYSRDGLRLASAGDDGTVRVWSLADQRELLSIPAHEGLAFQVQFTADDAILISCGNDPTLRLWDSQTGEDLGKLSGHARTLEAFALSPEGQWLASTGFGGTIVWDLGEQRPRFQFLSENPTIQHRAVAVSPDGQWIAAADFTGLITLWNAHTGAAAATARHLDDAHCIAFSEEGRYLASGDAAGTLCVWDLEPVRASLGAELEKPVELVRLRQWPGHQKRVYAVQFAPEGRLLTAGADGAIRVWRLSTLLNPPTETTDETEVYHPFFTPQGQLFAVMHDVVVRWDLSRNPCLSHYARYPFEGEFLVGDARGKRAVSFSSKGQIVLWSLSSGEVERRWQVEKIVHGSDLCLSPEGTQLAVYVNEPAREVRIFRTTDGALVATQAEPQGAVGRLRFSPNGKQLAYQVDSNLMLWNYEREAAYRATSDHAHSDMLSGLAYNSDGALLATCGADRLVKLWDARRGVLLATLSGHRDAVNAVVFSPDGRSLFSADLGGVVKVWNVATREELFDLLKHSEGLYQMCISPDGAWLACTTLDQGRLVLTPLARGQ
jgi:WD40 repeat protein/tRNA A-37 threonylcarbamoyl transferase component Bud32